MEDQEEYIKMLELKVQELEKEKAGIQEKLRDTENVLKNQVRTNTEHYHDNQALKERIQFLEGKVKEYEIEFGRL